MEQLPFNIPALIRYSSGSTRQPKSTVQSVGGIVLNGVKEGVLHKCLKSRSIAFQYTTTRGVGKTF